MNPHHVEPEFRGQSPVPFASALEARPGLTLLWGPSSADFRPPCPVGLWIVCEPDPAPGRMRLERARRRCDCATGALNFVTALHLTPGAALELLAGDPSPGAAALRAFATGGATGFATALTARAQLALDSIRCCPFAGICRDMALTARAHDLLVEFLTAWNNALAQPAAAAPNAAEAVRFAAEILEREMEHPPALSDLAARIGVSETTLKRTFPRVFGTTVFGYLRRRRMEEARRLIESGSATVLEAAASVGYSNPSNFAAAFRREFGVNPKSHQLAARR